MAAVTLDKHFKTQLAIDLTTMPQVKDIDPNPLAREDV